jgi:D-aminoacyl-tRNA deacylase
VCGPATTWDGTEAEEKTTMRAVVQRVSRASVTVGDEVVASSGPGLVALVGVGHDDGEADARWIARKIAGLRVFTDGAGKMNRSVRDVGGTIVVVSQFTLLADCRKGRRPSFVGAAPTAEAEPLVQRVAECIGEQGVDVRTGRFGAHMHLDLLNDGPVTLVIDSP